MNILHLQIGDPRKLVMAFVGRGVTLAPKVHQTTMNESKKRYRDKMKRINLFLGLRTDGKPRKRFKRDLGGLSKNHREYMRLWRRDRLEEARWQWALGNIREQAFNKSVEARFGKHFKDGPK